MDNDTRLKLAIYHHFAQTGQAPEAEVLGRTLGQSGEEIIAGFARLRQNRVLWLRRDGRRIRMAPPFSAVATQHRVIVGGLDYFANCAWDALGIPAALKQDGTVFSRCEQSGEPLVMKVTRDAPPSSDWLFHCLVPAAHWWQDLPFT